MPYNFALNAVEGAVNFLFNGASVPGLPDYMGFLEPLKANYYNPTGGLLEVGMGVLSLRGVGGRSTALLETAEAGNARYRVVDRSMLTPGQRLGRVNGVSNNAMRLSSTGGRNITPLREVQIDEATTFARKLGFDGPVDYRPLDRGYNTSYSNWDWLIISDDLLPNTMGNMANSRMSWKAALGHELVGHGQSNWAGRSFEAGSLLDEVQASARASRHTPELFSLERYQLRRDAIERIKMHNQQNGTNLGWRDLRDQLWLDPYSN
ncbi:hypothetical protein HNQ59_003970 [Chitinivorax tropicus]|uniref:Uncharacterized protein n=1 Tax=Chitinivorax tropicus TaxID=714531 RepID=A0A840MTB3_9PROT|nr:hypothetical protein [Chitinivorax tropicus]MBB5020645.1 hypothetical protein [Chitinivorax tropicus]